MQFLCQMIKIERLFMSAVQIDIEDVSPIRPVKNIDLNVFSLDRRNTKISQK